MHVSIEGLGYHFTIFFQVLYVLCFTRPRYQMSVYRTIGPLFGICLADVDYWKCAYIILISLCNLL